ncbi:hypothetical protein [Luteolibacter sp. AS25]|uniref:hypothetical protein n=1 Tax=Luteolibacter sp. AS25 TaxID=3135776 RepID=UPI00398B9D4B
MKTNSIKFLPFVLLTLATAHGQNLEKSEISEDVQKAIEEFNSKRASGNKEPNEVVVVFEPTAPATKQAPQKITEKQVTTELPPEIKPILVSGKQPEELAGPEPALQIAPPIEDGLTIRVKPLTKGDGTIDPSKVTLKAPFPAKPLANTPQDWILIKSPDAPTFKEVVELQPGKKITLEIPPHVLVPVSDGQNHFSILEPGFNNKEGYSQTETVDAILSRSITQLDEDSKQLSNALSDLHLLLASLPAPDEEPAQTPADQ